MMYVIVMISSVATHDIERIVATLQQHPAAPDA
jgi:hypothetical protein